MNDKTINIRIDTDTKDKLKELAEAENRTISNYIKTHIQDEYAEKNGTRTLHIFDNTTILEIAEHIARGGHFIYHSHDTNYEPTEHLYVNIKLRFRYYDLDGNFDKERSERCNKILFNPFAIRQCRAYPQLRSLTVADGNFITEDWEGFVGIITIDIVETYLYLPKDVIEKVNVYDYDFDDLKYDFEKSFVVLGGSLCLMPTNKLSDCLCFSECEINVHEREAKEKA